MSPIQFLKEVREELNRVTWPSKDEVVEATLGVIVFCGFLAFYFWVLDSILTRLLELIIVK